MMRQIASIKSSDVTGEQLNIFDRMLNEMADEYAAHRHEGDLIEFLTNLSEALHLGEDLVLFATPPK